MCVCVHIQRTKNNASEEKQGGGREILTPREIYDKGIQIKTARHGYAAAAKSLQSCPTLCDPIDGSPPGFPVPGILQARTLEWVAISFSDAWKWKVKVKSLSRFRHLATPWSAAYQAPPSMGFSRQEYWSGCHCLLQGTGIGIDKKMARTAQRSSKQTPVYMETGIYNNRHYTSAR